MKTFVGGCSVVVVFFRWSAKVSLYAFLPSLQSLGRGARAEEGQEEPLAKRLKVTQTHFQGRRRERQGSAQEERLLREEEEPQRQRQQREAGRAAAVWKGRRLCLLFSLCEGLLCPVLTKRRLTVTLIAGDPKEQLVFAESQGVCGEQTSPQI